MTSRFSGWILYLSVACVFLLFFRIATLALPADAAVNLLNPHVCLGGWKNAYAASGEATLSENAPPEEFNSLNSAYLNPEISAQIFCAGFSPEARDTPPYAVSLDFHWLVLSVPATASPENILPDSPAPVDTPFSGTTFDQPSTTVETIIPALDPIPEETSDIPSPAPIPEETSDIPSPVPVSPPDTSPSSDFSDPLPSGDSSSPVLDPGPSQPSSSLYQNILSFLRPHEAHAEEAFSGFLQVSYTYNGVEWLNAGTVTEDNWRNFSIPLNNVSWEELRQLQVKIETLPIAGKRPEVFLDAVLLHVQDSPTIFEMAGDQVSAVGSLASAALGFVDELANSAVSLLSGQPENVAAVPSASLPSPVEEQPALPSMKKVLAFEVSGSPVAAERVLPWYDDETKSKVSKEKGFLAPPDVSISDDGLTITVKGVCTKEYFVVMTFRHPDDYKDRPQTFASNFADKCVGRSFTYNLGLLPIDTKEDVYYLVTADQEEKGPWVLSSALLPIRVTHKEIETIQ